MRVARRVFLASLTASLAAPAILRRAHADAPVTTLKLHHFFSSVSGAHERFLVPWARQVEAQSGGRIRIDIFPSMQLGGAPAQLLDQARDGLADMVWAAPGSAPGRFVKIEAFELPFVPSRRALVNSRALEDYAAANLQDEFRDVHPLCFSCRDRGIVHTDRAVRSIAELKSLRLHVTNRLAGEALGALGAYGITVPVPQVPMALAGHAIDGCLDPWDVVPSLHLGDLLKFHTDFAESSLSTSAFVLAMNKGSYEKLPRELKTVIDANSGQDAARMAGTMWDLEARAVPDTARARGDTVIVLTAEEIVHWRKATEPVVAQWLKQMKERKLDGGKLIAAARAAIAKYAGEPEPQQQAPQTSQAPEPKVMSEPAPQVPQTKAEVIAPKADAPAVAPAVKRAAPKELDIPL
jgi:TRAP-type C4-dicarboxylate transport system substrate-binding protein